MPESSTQQRGSDMSTTIIYAFVFAAVLLIVDAVARSVTGFSRARSEVNARLARLTAGGDQTATYQKLLQDRGAADGFLDAGIFGWVARMYRQSGLQMTMRSRILYVISVTLVSILVLRFVVSSGLLQILFGLIAGPVVCLLFVVRLRARRLKKFVEQLPLAIDIIVRSLNAGHPLLAAVSLVGREMPDPIGSEFGLLSDQLTFGLELDRAMLNMVDRVGADELNLLAITVSVQRGTGGNLSEILENLAGMIRDRTLLKAKIRAISAEGRMTARVMAAFPFVLYMIISTLAPQYFDPVWESGYANVMIFGILAFLSVGLIILNKIVRFDF